ANAHRITAAVQRSRKLISYRGGRIGYARLRCSSAGFCGAFASSAGFLAARGEGGPALPGEALQGRETRLVGHLRALFDPVAEIDIRQALPAAFLDEPENAPGAEALLAAARIVKGVNGREAVIEPVDQRHGGKRAFGIAEFGDRGPYRAVLDHAAVIGIGHRRHVAVAVARVLVGGKQLELLGRCAPGHEPRAQPAVNIAHPAGRTGIGEFLDGDPHRHASGALAAGRAVGKAVAAAESGARQLVIKTGGAAAGQLDDQLALGAVGDVRAGDGGRREELRERAEPAAQRGIRSGGLEAVDGPLRCRSAPARADVHADPLANRPWPAAPAFRRRLVAACQRAASQTTTPVLPSGYGRSDEGSGPPRTQCFRPEPRGFSGVFTLIRNL